MISERMVCKFCKDDISLIENYNKAIYDTTQIWDCHHRLEIDENKSIVQLVNEGRYYNRPAIELIFLTHSDHVSLHNKQRTGRKRTQEQRETMRKSRKQYYETHTISDETRKKQSDANKIITWINNGKENKRVRPEQLQQYLITGYKLGRLPFRKNI